jgi:hypothetical protein
VCATVALVVMAGPAALLSISLGLPRRGTEHRSLKGRHPAAGGVPAGPGLTWAHGDGAAAVRAAGVAAAAKAVLARGGICKHTHCSGVRLRNLQLWSCTAAMARQQAPP